MRLQFSVSGCWFSVVWQVLWMYIVYIDSLIETYNTIYEWITDNFRRILGIQT